jgi:hypothetical protein
MLHLLSDLSAGGHQALALFLVLSYGAVTAVSVSAHSERHKYKNMQLRAVSLLREAARSSQRAKKGGDAGDVYADSARARIYVSAVDRLLSSEEVAKLTGVSLDELRAHIDHQLADARSALSRTTAASGNTAFQSAPLVGGGSHIPNYVDLGSSEPISAFTRGATVRLGGHK